jgi:hypothetical protein
VENSGAGRGFEEGKKNPVTHDDEERREERRTWKEGMEEEHEESRIEWNMKSFLRDTGRLRRKRGN